MLINVPDNVAKSLNDKSVIKIRFCDDDFHATHGIVQPLKKDDAFSEAEYEKLAHRYAVSVLPIRARAWSRHRA